MTPEALCPCAPGHLLGPAPPGPAPPCPPSHHQSPAPSPSHLLHPSQPGGPLGKVTVGLLPAQPTTSY